MGDFAGIIVAIITSLASLAGVIITVNAQSKKFEEQMKDRYQKLLDRYNKQ